MTVELTFKTFFLVYTVFPHTSQQIRVLIFLCGCCGPDDTRLNYFFDELRAHVVRPLFYNHNRGSQTESVGSLCTSPLTLSSLDIVVTMASGALMLVHRQTEARRVVPRDSSSMTLQTGILRPCHLPRNMDRKPKILNVYAH